MGGWASPYDLFREELDQQRDEGCIIPKLLRRRFAELHPIQDQWNYERIKPLYAELMALEGDAESAARHPNDLAAIRALRPDGPRDLHYRPADGELLDRLHGAWTGRCVGCALGKTVEIMALGRDAAGRLDGRQNVKRYLTNRGHWPLADFFSNIDAGDGLKLSPWCKRSERENIAFMEPDDDIHYTLTGLGVVEENGPDFDWQMVGRYWLSHIPPMYICGELQPLQNLMRRSMRGWQGSVTPQFTRRHWNPYRESVGAQIRCDGYAYLCAGKPELAAEFAWRDAHWTHERNGIYGAMMFAAIQSAAFVESDPFRLIEIGLSEIPADCRLARMAREALRWIRTEKDFEGCMVRLEEALGDMITYHVINNALVCMIALCHGGMDANHAPAVAVMCGLDTDCNGATVGSVVGARCGRKRFGGIMAPRLNDTMRPAMVDFQGVSLAELAQRSLVQWKRVDGYWRERQARAPALAVGQAVP